MGQLFDQIRAAVRADRFYVSDHADERLRERGILAWHVIAGLEQGRLLSERPSDKPNPSVEVDQVLPDGTSILAVWAYWRDMAAAKLVTVPFYDR